jgi:hypothetical protein
MVNLTGREHLLHLAGQSFGHAAGLKEAAGQLKKAAQHYRVSYSEMAKESKEYEAFLPHVDQLAKSYEAIAEQFGEQIDKLQKEASGLLDRAYNSQEPDSLRKKLRRAIISAAGAWKGK